jgi:hypothetical protein
MRGSVQHRNVGQWRAGTVGVAASEWASAGGQLQKVSHLGSGLIWTPFVQSGKRSCRYSGEVVAGGRCGADTGLGESAPKEVHDRATGSAGNGRAHGGGGGGRGSIATRA